MKLNFSTNFKTYPISKANFSLLMYYSGIGDQVWEPFTCLNAGVFYTKLFHFSRVIGKFSRLTNENGSYIEAHFFSEKKVLKDTLHPNFTQYEKYSMAEIIPALSDLNDRIKEETNKSSKLEPNRKGTFVLIDLEDIHCNELEKSKHLRHMLIDLLNGSSEQRIYIFLFSQRAKYVPVEIHQALSWAAYLENENIGFAKGLFNKEEEIFNEKRKIIGTLNRPERELLTPIHETIFEASDYKYLSDKHLEIEDESYRRFLNSLG